MNRISFTLHCAAVMTVGTSLWATSARGAPIPMDLARFQQLAGGHTDRCNEAIAKPECQDDLAYGLIKGYITQSAYDWGSANGYYPVIDDHHQKVGAVCKCGCFEASTRLLTENENWEDEWKAVRDIADHTYIGSLDPNASLTRPMIIFHPLRAMTRGAETIALYVFHLSNGATLKVTQNHGMVLSDGRVVEAKTVKQGDSFVSVRGEDLAIKEIDRELTSDDVYNFEASTNEIAGHILAAEGVLVGDLSWQNQLSNELGSIAIRR